MIKPLANRVLIKKIGNEEKTKSGIILKENNNNSPQYAQVIEIGDGIDENGKEIKPIVKKKDKVLVNKYSGTEISFEGEDFIIINQNDILAIIY